MSVKRYNELWRSIAEHWDNKEELTKIYTKVNKIKQSKVVNLKAELKALRDAGEINKNIKLNQSEAKLKDIYNSHYLSRFDNEEFFVKPKTRAVLTEVKNFKNAVKNYTFQNDDDVEWGYSSFRLLNHTIPTIRKTMKDHHNVKVNFQMTFVMEHNPNPNPNRKVMELMKRILLNFIMHHNLTPYTILVRLIIAWLRSSPK
jgi:phosphoribosylformylglycinamidine (FGAM) synthase PurS component